MCIVTAMALPPENKYCEVVQYFIQEVEKNRFYIW